MGHYVKKHFIRDMKKNIILAYDYLTPFKRKQVRSCFLSDEVGAVLGSIKSSHDVIFVFNEKNEFAGLVSPNWTLYKKRFPYFTKVAKAIYNPPFLTKEDDLFKVVSYMVFLRMHQLPVFNSSGKIEFVITASNILNKIIKSQKFVVLVSKKLTIKRPITISQDSTIEKAYQRMKQNNISRLVVVDSLNKAIGILSRRDILPVFTAKTPKQRFGRRLMRYHYASYYDEEKPRKLNIPISNTKYERRLLYIKSYKSRAELLKKMITHNRNSIVILNNKNEPTGFVSRRDFLKAILKLKPSMKIPYKINDTEGKLSTEVRDNLKSIISDYLEKKQKQYSINRSELFVETVLNSAGQVKLYELVNKLYLKSGEVYISSEKKPDIKKALLSSFKKLDAQIKD